MWLNFSAATCEITTLGRANVTKETAHKKQKHKLLHVSKANLTATKNQRTYKDHKWLEKMRQAFYQSVI